MGSTPRPHASLGRARTNVFIALVTGFLAGCAGNEEAPIPDRVVEPDPQLLFWEGLNELCGQAFEGRVVENVPPDSSFEGRALVMHVRSCDPGEIHIPFHVGDDRSRTWVVTTTAVGLRLKHDHRHEDGTEDAITQYGGDTRGRGTSAAQDFHADPFTVAGNFHAIDIPSFVLSQNQRVILTSAERLESPKYLDLFFLHPVGFEPGGRFHGGQGQ